MTTTTDSQGRGGRRPPTALAVLAALGLVLGVALLVFALTQQTPDPPAPAAQQPAAAPVEGRLPGPPPDLVEKPDELGALPDAEAGPEPGAGAEQEPEAEVEQLPASAPTQVRIPSISVTSPLHPLGLAADGTLEVPSGDRFDEAAWYQGSPTPGEVGPTVIEGHVTGTGGRPSVFFELGALGSGDLVEVDREDGSTVTFEVYRVEQFPKDAFPTVAVYGPTEGPELRLITCGGDVDQASGHHLDNTVAYARMVPAR